MASTRDGHGNGKDVRKWFNVLDALTRYNMCTLISAVLLPLL